MPKRTETEKTFDERDDPEVLESYMTGRFGSKTASAPESLRVAEPVLRADQAAAAAYLTAVGAPPAPPAPEPRQDMRAGKRPAPSDQTEPRLSARQFVRARRHRWEQCAGFLLEMKLQLGPQARLTMLEWTPLWEAFWTRPIGGIRR